MHRLGIRTIAVLLACTLAGCSLDLKSEYDDMTPAELIKKRKREMTKTLKYWLGTLDKKQIASIGEWAQRCPMVACNG
jgi:hypothetical protein